ncbi:MAG TPA: hypothetical protein VK689_01745 [Armatimonadota bacterium]|nr:hypothetical protein [Armatimonadota bacterium]
MTSCSRPALRGDTLARARAACGALLCLLALRPVAADKNNVSNIPEAAPEAGARIDPGKAAVREALEARHAQRVAARHAGDFMALKRLLEGWAAPEFKFSVPGGKSAATRAAALREFLAWEKQNMGLMRDPMPMSKPVGTPNYTINKLGVAGDTATEEGALSYSRIQTDAQGTPLPTEFETEDGRVFAVNQTAVFHEQMKIIWVRTPQGWKMRSVEILGVVGVL